MSTRTDDRDATSPEQPPALQLVDAATVAGLPRQDLAPGVTYAQLWTEGRSFAGVFHLEPDAVIPEHTHTYHCHHIWTLQGQVRILDRLLTPGSYAYVAPGQPHDLVAGAEGATAFYLYLVTSTP
jgi:quercetin dioxygenase-like cupin family protein